MFLFPSLLDISFHQTEDSGTIRALKLPLIGQFSSCLGAIDDSMLLMLFWILTGLSVLGLFSKQYGLQPLTLALILRSIYHLGIGNTLILLGSLNVRRSSAVTGSAS